jgi:glycosyltransferase involved in cell wall biosynthesis
MHSAPTLHLVYPHGPAISCPDAIGRNLVQRLGGKHRIRPYAWDDRGIIHPEPGDCIVGHPHPDPRTIFRRSVRIPGWKRRIMLCPYSHKDPRQVAMWDTVLPHCDLHLAITGNYWFNAMEESLFAHWRAKSVHVDLAVDRADFPLLKTKFGPPGRRAVLYIGNKLWFKNTPYLSEIARLLPGVTFRWIGSSRGGIDGFESMGRFDFRTEEGRHAVAEHDITLTVGFSDPNPTTILESMAWGLIPVCTPQSGYAGYNSILNVPLGYPRAAADVLRKLQDAPEQELRALQAENLRLVDTHFHWDRFARQVDEALSSDASPPLGPEPALRKARLRWAALVSPYVPWHPREVARSVYHALRRNHQETP